MKNFDKFGAGVGLHRIAAFAEFAGIDLNRFSEISIVVVGSNGKGSTSSFIATGLKGSFERIGHFTSPHLMRITERFKINGVEISADDFQRYYDRVWEFADTLAKSDDRLGAFEALFLVACQWFRDSDVDCVVWEAGIGGRYDPTRAIKAQTAVLTSIELEHVELLGATEELIAYDKIDAVFAGGSIIVSQSVPTALNEKISAYCALKPVAPLFMAGQNPIRSKTVTTTGTAVFFGDGGEAVHQMNLSMLGDYQAENAVAALATVKVFLDRQQKPCDDPQIIRCLEETIVPGRLQKISTGPDIWIDVGHTPVAISRTIDSWLEVFTSEETLIVVGISNNKNIEEIAKTINDQFSNILLTSASKNGTSPSQLKPLFADIVDSQPDISKAVGASVKFANAHGLKILVLGGLFTAIEYQYALEGGDPKTLEFF